LAETSIKEKNPVGLICSFELFIFKDKTKVKKLDQKRVNSLEFDHPLGTQNNNPFLGAPFS
jgi:hypothetical protein